MRRFADSADSSAAAGHQNQVIAELGLHGTLDFVDRRTENHLVEFGNHHARTKAAQIAALCTGRASGMLLGQGGKISTGLDLLLEFQALGFGADEDVAGGGLYHEGLRLE